MDADNDADDLVDYFIIEDSSFLPTNEYTTFTTYTGQHSSSVTLRLRYRLRCRGNWHGYNCDIYCVDQDTDTAHLECALDGSRVCMDGWEDLSTQCTIREFKTHTHTHDTFSTTFTIYQCSFSLSLSLGQLSVKRVATVSEVHATSRGNASELTCVITKYLHFYIHLCMQLATHFASPVL